MEKPVDKVKMPQDLSDLDHIFMVKRLHFLKEILIPINWKLTNAQQKFKRS